MDFLAKNIVLLRNLKELSQTEIANQLGFKRTTWNNYESGVSTPILRDALHIAKFFDVSLDDLATKDLKADVNLIAKYKDSKYWEKVNLNVNAIVNANRKNQGSLAQYTKIETAFNPTLNEDQTPYKSIPQQLHDLSNKVAKIETNMGKRIALMEDKIQALSKALVKK